MSSISERAKGGISINWTIENFNLIQNIWWTAFPLEWAKTNSKWKMEINFSSDEGSTNCVRLIIEKLDKQEPFCLSGTIFAVVEKFTFELQQLEENNFLKSKEKHIWLTPNQGIDFEKKGLINNGSLTLRINLWDSNINDKIAAEYFVRSSYIQQMCSFQWMLKGNRDWKRNRDCTESSTDIPMEFIDFSMNSNMQTFRVNSKLQIKDENMFMVLQMKDTNSKLKSFWIRGRYNFKIQTKEGIKPFGEDKWNAFEFFSFKNYKNIITDELWDNIAAEWNVKFEIIIVTDFRGVTERICYEPKSQSLPKRSSVAKKRKHDSNDSLQHSLHTLYKEGKFCDLILRTHNETFPCHRNVLCARSTVFRTMFEKNMLGTKISITNIDEVDPRILGMFLNYLYSDNLEEENFDSAIKLYIVADKYEVLKLQKMCASVIVSCLSVDNACEALSLADRHKDDDLKDEIISFFCSHSKEIMNSTGWKQLLPIHPLLAAKTAQAVLTKLQ